MTVKKIIEGWEVGQRKWWLTKQEVDDTHRRSISTRLDLQLGKRCKTKRMREIYVGPDFAREYIETSDDIVASHRIVMYNQVTGHPHASTLHEM